MMFGDVDPSLLTLFDRRLRRYPFVVPFFGPTDDPLDDPCRLVCKSVQLKLQVPKRLVVCLVRDGQNMSITS